MSPPDVLSRVLGHARQSPDHPALADLDRQLSYGQLVEAMERSADGMLSAGVVSGDRVALHLPNSVEFVVAALAALRIGAIFIPVAVTDPDARLAGILADCTPVLVVTGDDNEETDPHRIYGPAAWIPFASLGTAGTGHRPLPPEPAPGRPVYAIYTSGTTGSPKGVLIGDRAFAAAVDATVDALGIDRSTRTLCVSPFHFDGSFATLFPTLAAGGTVVIRPRDSLLFPRTFFKAVLNEDITYTGFSPSYLKLLLASPQVEKLNGSTLSIVALGGEATTLATIRSTWQAVPQLRIFNRYGPTETAIVVSHVELTPELLSEGTIPIGVPHPGVTFHLVDESGSEVSDDDTVGELYIGGDQLMDGYWGAPALTESVMRTDLVPGRTVYRTGDLVYRNARGHYVYVDRADRVIKRFGVRISLLELADALHSLEGVSAAACVVFDDEGEVGIAAFVTADGTSSAVELRASVREHLPDTMLPDRIVLVDELPLTSASKLDERLLLAEAGLSQAPSVSTTARRPA
jgi:D-alanine--poly(phosphoribitol) ligase subunit 1